MITNSLDGFKGGLEKFKRDITAGGQKDAHVLNKHGVNEIHFMIRHAQLNLDHAGNAFYFKILQTMGSSIMT